MTTLESNMSLIPYPCVAIVAHDRMTS